MKNLHLLVYRVVRKLDLTNKNTKKKDNDNDKYIAVQSAGRVQECRYNCPLCHRSNSNQQMHKLKPRCTVFDPILVYLPVPPCAIVV